MALPPLGAQRHHRPLDWSVLRRRTQPRAPASLEAKSGESGTARRASNSEPAVPQILDAVHGPDEGALRSDIAPIQCPLAGLRWDDALPNGDEWPSSSSDGSDWP